MSTQPSYPVGWFPPAGVPVGRGTAPRRWVRTPRPPPFRRGPPTKPANLDSRRTIPRLHKRPDRIPTAESLDHLPSTTSSRLYR